MQDKQRLGTHLEAFGCKFGLYISQRKNLNGQWAIGWTKHQHHNHQPLADPFLYADLRKYRPRHALARQIATTHRGILSFKDLLEILEKEGLQVGRKEYYNLIRKEKTTPLTRSEEIKVLLAALEHKGFYPRTREEYIV